MSKISIEHQSAFNIAHKIVQSAKRTAYQDDTKTVNTADRNHLGQSFEHLIKNTYR